MPKRKVLYICHNHPSVRPGGAEAYALELYEAMRDSSDFEPVFLAKGGPPISNFGRTHEGTLLGGINDDPNQYFFYTDDGDFDWLMGTCRNKDILKFFADFLLACQPDIVHFQHTLFYGYDILRLTRNLLPQTPIVYTLHEFLPICHRNGQMLRTIRNQPCTHASPKRCNECFPDIPAANFLLRQKFVQSHFEVVDQFIAPSQFLLERFADWGIPRHKLLLDDYGRSESHQAIPHDAETTKSANATRNRFGFFGQFNPFKGLDVALNAMKILDEEYESETSETMERSDRSEPHLWVHGANLELQPGQFQNLIKSSLESVKTNTTLIGQYSHDELPKLMSQLDWIIVPSIWYENSPLVIQEAFMYGKPVICSDIGGMAEKVTDGVNGLHFRAGDPRSLAKVIRRAVETPGLWETLSKGVPQVYRMQDHVSNLSRLYEGMLLRTNRN